MADIVSADVRSRMMSGIKGKDTKPELIVRKSLHRAGFRYRLHDRRLPGKPDMVFPKWQAVIFVHGCFWHGHDCHLFRLPSTRTEFWKDKIDGNIERDRKSCSRLLADEWRVATVWECALKGKTKRNIEEVVSSLSIWLQSDAKELEVRGAMA